MGKMNYSELNSITRSFLMNKGKAKSSVSDDDIQQLTNLLHEVVRTSPSSSSKINQAIEKLKDIQKATSNLENKISILERKLEILEEK